MIHHHSTPWKIFISTLLLTLFVFVCIGCGSSVKVQPEADEQQAQLNHAGHIAFDQGRTRQALSLFTQSRDRAYLRDDQRAIVDAQYNRAACLARLQQYQQALDLLQATESIATELEDDRLGDLMLLEARILFRKNDLASAWATTELLLIATKSPTVQSLNYALRGQIACQQQNVKLAEEQFAHLDATNTQDIQADYAQLAGLIALLKNESVDAIHYFETEIKLRRLAGQYLAMARALAHAGQAYENNNQSDKAATYYLRAGRSGQLLGHTQLASQYLTKAKQLAMQLSMDDIVEETNRRLNKLKETGR